MAFFAFSTVENELEDSPDAEQIYRTSDAEEPEELPVPLPLDIFQMKSLVCSFRGSVSS